MMVTVRVFSVNEVGYVMLDAALSQTRVPSASVNLYWPPLGVDMVLVAVRTARDPPPVSREAKPPPPAEDKAREVTVFQGNFSGKRPLIDR